VQSRCQLADMIMKLRLTRLANDEVVGWNLMILALNVD
jgi:hypothetical protein